MNYLDASVLVEAFEKAQKEFSIAVADAVLHGTEETTEVKEELRHKYTIIFELRHKIIAGLGGI